MNTQGDSPIQALSGREFEKAVREMQSLILQGLASATQTAIAEKVGITDSKLSRMKEEFELFCRMLVALNLHLHDASSPIIDANELQSLRVLARKYLEAE